MKPLSVIGACVGGVLGAVVWALASWQLDFELGYLAWGVGALVGYGCVVGRSRGPVAGGVCAVVALFAIFGGKLFATSLNLSTSFDAESVESQVLNESNFMSDMMLAERFGKLRGEQDYKKFIISEGYTSATEVKQLTDQDVSYFKYRVVPQLRNWSASPPTYEMWKAEKRSEAKEAVDAYQERAESVSALEMMNQSLNHIDIIFALLGTVTAFAIGYGLKGETAKPTRRY